MHNAQLESVGESASTPEISMGKHSVNCRLNKNSQYRVSNLPSVSKLVGQNGGLGRDVQSHADWEHSSDKENASRPINLVRRNIKIMIVI